MTAESKVPYIGISFEVSADGQSLGSFTECSGLDIDIGTEDYKEGGNNHFVHKLPGHASSQPVKLKKGLTDSKKLWDWIRTFTEQSKVTPKVVQVQLRTPGPSSKAVRSWIVDHAYPIKWEGPQLNAMRGEVVFESVELAHRGISIGK